MNSVYPEIEYPSENYQIYNDIKNCKGFDVHKFFRENDVLDLRLPLNNKEAYYYLNWLNLHFSPPIILNFILNVFENFIGVDKSCNIPVRPPTFREISVHSVDNLKETIEEDMKNGNHALVDSAFGLASEAYRMDDMNLLLESGIVGCFLKFGTWDSNKKDFKFRTYEEMLKS